MPKPKAEIQNAGISADTRLDDIFIKNICPEDKKQLVKRGDYLFCKMCNKIKANIAGRQK